MLDEDGWLPGQACAIRGMVIFANIQPVNPASDTRLLCWKTRHFRELSKGCPARCYRSNMQSWLTVAAKDMLAVVACCGIGAFIDFYIGKSGQRRVKTGWKRGGLNPATFGGVL